MKTTCISSLSKRGAFLACAILAFAGLGTKAEVGPKLAIKSGESNFSISWSEKVPGFVLECADQLAGAWVSVPGVTGDSALLSTAAPRQFFRLRNATGTNPPPDGMRLDYLGQPAPGETPQVFARGLVSTDEQEHSAPAFSPDGKEVFWWLNRRSGGGAMMTMRRVGDNWTAPTVAPYGGAPAFSPDGQRLYFESSRPTSDGKADGPYFVEKQGDRWGAQKCGGLVARFPEVQFAYNLSIASNGTLYFLGYAAGLGLWNNFGIYRAELLNGEYIKPELLPPGINGPAGTRNWTPYIAPDESYLIFSSNRGKPSDLNGDLYVCFRQPEGSWTDPVGLGAPINSIQNERFPAVSPDGRYLFFTRWTPDHDEDVFWVSAGIIDKLQAKAIH